MAHTRIKYKLLAGHFLLAMIINSSQPLLPVLKGNLGLSVLEVSILPSVITFAVMIANLFAGILVARMGQKTLLMSSLGIMFAGIALAFFAPSFGAIAGAFALMGMAVGWGFTGLTTMYSHLPEKMQNFGLYHAAFGLGGVGAPLLLNQLLRAGLAYNWIYAVFALVVIFLVLIMGLDREVKNVRYADIPFSEMVSVFRLPLVLLALLALGIYAAVEIGATNLSSVMSVDGYGRSEIFAGNILVLFWLVFTLSRLFADGLARRIGSLRITVISAVSGFIIILLWSLGFSPWLFPLLGLFLGPVFPILQKFVNLKLSPSHRGIFTGVSYAATGTAATLVLPLMGRLGDIRMGYAFLPSLVLLVLLIVNMLMLARRPAEARG